MRRLPEIPINQFQLAILLSEDKKQGYQFLLDQGVVCFHCNGIDQKGIVVTEMYLTPLNDILVRGTCNVCGGKVARIMEFGEDSAFYESANDFRRAIGEI